MALSTGHTLSFYEILGPLGAGGMGEVYRARDTRLEREVAIKVLPEELSGDEERLRRFEREAKTLATLNHPNIAGIHGVDQVGDLCFLALELVPGEDLAVRLSRGALPLDEAIDVCRQIAEGLEAAHEAGIVHRDLKPANVRITPDGVVKLLDFGLAKPMHPHASAAGTSTAQPDSFLLTEEGLVLGTPVYMSPEQARGKPVDRRTDIWAFGCVLYECLTGRRAFAGDSLPDILAAIVQQEPDWTRVPDGAGKDVRRLLRRCLTKDARVRLRDIGEARVSLGGQVAAPEVVEPRDRGGRALALFVAGLAVASLAWFGSRSWLTPINVTGAPAHQKALHVTIDWPIAGSWSKLSPDGSRLLFAASGQLWLHDLADLEPRPIPGTQGGGLEGFDALLWSQDSASIAFIRDGYLEILRLGESRAERRCPVPAQVVNCSWGDNGAFLFEVGGKSEGISYLPPGGVSPGQLDWIDPEPLTNPHRFNPAFLPGGEEFLLTISSGDESWVHVASLSSRTVRPLVRARSRAEYVEPGWIAWVDEGTLLVQAFDPETSTVSGTPHELVDGVDSFVSTGVASFSFSAEGTLQYAPMDRPSKIEWVDRQGRVLGPAAEPQPYAMARLDRTGRWMAASIITPKNGFRDLWVVDLERGTPQRLTQRPGWENTPAWSPDGRRIAFAADWIGPPNIYLQTMDGGEATELVPFDNHVHYVGSWSPDGRSLVYVRFESDSDDADLWIVDVDSLERRPLFQSPSRKSEPEVSPDGRWISFTSRESGRDEVYVASFPAMTGRRRVSADGGRGARWTKDSAELYYLTASRAIASVDILESGGLPDPGTEVIVIQASDDLARFDVMPDASRFLVIRRNEGQIRPVSHLITRWERLLER